MTQPGIEGLAVGLHKGHKVTKIERKPRQDRHIGACSKKSKVSALLLSPSSCHSSDEGITLFFLAFPWAARVMLALGVSTVDIWTKPW